jgi:hypothetical protein
LSPGPFYSGSRIWTDIYDAYHLVEVLARAR